MEVALATSAVKLVLGKIGDLAVDKVFELYGVSDEVERMRVELTLIEGFLEDVDSNPPSNESRAVENWLNELRRVAENIDKVLESFKVEVPKGRWKAILKNPKKLNKVSTHVKQITQILKTLYERGTQLGITARAIATKDPTAPLSLTPTNQPSVEQITQILNQITQILHTHYEHGGEAVGTTCSATATGDPAPLPLTPPNEPSDVDDPEVFVGHESDKCNIIKKLLDQSISRRTVLSIVGIGGLGKTTLAQNVYNSAELEGHFQCRTWLSISQKFNENHILREILYSFKPQMKKKDPPLEDKNLVREVKSYLKDTKYLIILDDVWGTDLWDGLKKALPDANNGSRVIITTRFLNVARAADHNTNRYQLDLLTDDESVTLLFRTALQRVDNYPPELKDVAQKLIKKCGGLPLALVVLGGILSEQEDTFAAWDLVYRTMNWHDKDVDKKCMKILAMSYEALDVDLKQCFLYFACFPEDHIISIKQMTTMWMIEELIPKDGVGSLEDRAEKCLQELVKRCLVEVTKKSANGYFKYCRMHDLLRDLAVHKAKENFVIVFSKNGDGGNPQLAPNRVALHDGAHVSFGTKSTNTRSLFCFGKNSTVNYQQFGHLRVLLFEHVHLSQKYKSDIIWLEGLTHLRYLGFRYCHGVKRKFQDISFSGLKSLETLDCKGTRLDINSSLWEIPSLRHVIAGFGSVVQCPLNWDHLKNLQRIDRLRLSNIPTLECDLNLNTIKIEMCFTSADSNVPDWLDSSPVEDKLQDIRTLLSRTKHLVSLTVNSHPMDLPFPSDGTSGLSCHETIQSLYLRGPWWVRDAPVSMSVEMFPKYLTKLKLVLSQFKEDPMSILKRLQSLKILHLLEMSYRGTKMICSARGFASLQELKLKELDCLTDWIIEENALPVLRQLTIKRCENLYILPELQNVPSLQELIVTSASHQLYEISKTEDIQKIEHIPSVRITMERKL